MSFNQQQYFLYTGKVLGNCDIDFFIFRYRFHITRVKFLKFKRDQNSAQKFWIYINESKKLWNSMKMNKIKDA